MLSLIKKDFLLLGKYTLLIIIIVMVLPVSLAMKLEGMNESTSTLALIFEVVYAEILISRYLAIKENQYPKAVSFLCVLPYTRRMQVISKYILYFIILVFCFVVYFIETLFVPNLAGMNLELVLSVLFIVSVLYSIYMPVLYKFGYEKTKLIFILVMMAVPLMFSRIDVKVMTDGFAKMTYPAVFITSVAALLLSMMTSIKIFNEKEL